MTTTTPGNVYDPGVIVTIMGTFTDEVSGSPVDPSPLTLRIRDSTGTITAYTGVEVVRDSAGHYHYDLAVPVTNASAGYWTYRWEAPEPIVVASPDVSFQVRSSALLVA